MDGCGKDYDYVVEKTGGQSTQVRKTSLCGRERRRKNFIRLGVNIGKAYAYSRTRKGTWAVAQSPIMNTTVTLERLAKRGYENMMDYFCKHTLKFSEPLYA